MYSLKIKKIICKIFGHRWIHLNLSDTNPLNPDICLMCGIDKVVNKLNKKHETKRFRK